MAFVTLTGVRRGGTYALKVNDALPATVEPSSEAGVGCVVAIAGDRWRVQESAAAVRALLGMVELPGLRKSQDGQNLRVIREPITLRVNDIAAIAALDDPDMRSRVFTQTGDSYSLEQAPDDVEASVAEAASLRRR
jgi:hypothetical protein